MACLMDKKVIAMNKQAGKEGIKGNFAGDTLTKGGIIIVNKGGTELIHEFKQQSAGDHCSPEGQVIKCGTSYKLLKPIDAVF